MDCKHTLLVVVALVLFSDAVSAASGQPQVSRRQSRRMLADTEFIEVELSSGAHGDLSAHLLDGNTLPFRRLQDSEVSDGAYYGDDDEPTTLVQSSVSGGDDDDDGADAGDGDDDDDESPPGPFRTPNSQTATGYGPQGTSTGYGAAAMKRAEPGFVELPGSEGNEGDEGDEGNEGNDYPA